MKISPAQQTALRVLNFAAPNWKTLAQLGITNKTMAALELKGFILLRCEQGIYTLRLSEKGFRHLHDHAKAKA